MDSSPPGPPARAEYMERCKDFKLLQDAFEEALLFAGQTPDSLPSLGVRGVKDKHWALNHSVEKEYI